MPKIIGIDCDDTLSETLDQVLKHPRFVKNGIRKDDLTHSYELYENPKLSQVWIDKEWAIKVYYDFFLSDDYWNIQPVAWALEKLQELKSQWHTCILVTGRAAAIHEKTKQWVQQHFPGIFDSFLFSNHNIENEIPKSELCKQMGVEVMIEDNQDFVSDVSQHGIPCFLLDKPRNQRCIYEKDSWVIKVKSWEGIDLSLLL